MSSSTYTVLRGDSSIISSGLSLEQAVSAMFAECGYEIEFRPYDDEDPELCLFYRRLAGGVWKAYELIPAPNEPLTKDHYYRHAVLNWDEHISIMTDDKARLFLAEA